MKNPIKRFGFFLAVFLFSALVTFVFRSLLFRPGIVGHSWDWAIPNFPEQFRIQTETSFFIWDERLFGGSFSQFRIELLYWLAVSIFSQFGGEILSKAIPLVIFIIAGSSMFFAVRKIFSLNYFWVLMSALLYMLSPFAYSRLLGGHLTILLGYAFLPLILYFSASLFGGTSKTWRPKLAFLTLILVLSMPHPLVLLVSWGIIFLTAGTYFILKKKKRKSIAKMLPLVLIFWAVLNSYWLLPILFHVVGGGKLSARPWQPIIEELSFRLPYFKSVSRPLSELFSFSFPFGLATEFAYPLAGFIRPFFIFSSITLFALGFAAFYLVFKDRKKYLPVVFILAFIEILGIALVAGEKTIIGRLLFSLILRFAPFIFSGFSNPLRFLPLVILPFSVLPFITLTIIEEKLKYFDKIKMVLRGLMIFTLLVFFYPWFFRNLTTPVFEGFSQPMSLRVTKINPEDKEVFDFLKEFKDDFRVTYLPPGYISWPGEETDLSYCFNSIYSPKSVFAEYIQPALAEEIIKTLYSQDSSEDLSKLLGLASVKTIIYPHYERFDETYQVFIPRTVDYKPIVDRNWSEQKDIKKLPSPFATVDIYENDNFVPHIFIPKQVTFMEGGSSSLTDIVSFPDYQIRNAIFFPEKDENKTLLALDKADNIYVRPTYVSGDILSQIQIKEEDFYPDIRILPTSPLYPLIRFREGRLWQATKGNPKLRTDTALIFMAKRVAELKRMLELGEDASGAGAETAKHYQELLGDFSDQLNRLIESQEAENDFLVKSWIFLDDHRRNLNDIIQSSQSRELAKEIEQIFVKMEQVFSKIKENVWMSGDDKENKYLFSIPEEDNYSLFVSADIGDEFSLEIDGKLLTTKKELVDSQWLSLGEFNLGKGKHRLKVNLPGQPNLFTEIATSSAVKRTPSSEELENSYQFFAQRENKVINVHLAGLDDQAKYRVSLKYKALGSPVRFTLEQANDEEFQGMVIHKIDGLFSMEDTWERFEAVFSPNFGSHEADLKFYLPADKNQTDTYFFEDIKVKRVLVPSFLFKKEKKTKSIQLPEITFTKINPTKYKVKVEEATDPYFLVFSETFNNNWKAYIQTSNFKPQAFGNIIAEYFDGEIKEGEHRNILLDREVFANVFKRPISKENHLLVNAFANTWYIDQPGSYEIILEFIPQRIYFLGLWISLMSFVFALGFLGVSLIRRRG
jgi:hypothetical protein